MIEAIRKALRSAWAEFWSVFYRTRSQQKRRARLGNGDF